MAEGADFLVIELCAVCLSCVFEEEETVFVADGDEVVHFAGVTEEVDGDDGFGFGGNFFFNFLGIDIHGLGIDIDEDGCGVEVGDAPGGGCEGEGGGDDFVTWLDAKGHEAEVEGGGAAVGGDAVFGVVVGGEGLFEGFDFWAEDEVAAVYDAGDGFHEFIFNIEVSLSDVEVGYFFFNHMFDIMWILWRWCKQLFFLL